MKKLLLAGMLAALLIPAGDAAARKVGNPGAFSAVVKDGHLEVGSQSFDFDDSDPDEDITFSGTVDGQGNLLIPVSQFDFPDIPITVSGIDITIHINVVGDPSNASNVKGTIDPLTGAASVRLRVWIKIDGVPFNGGCRIGSAGSPIDINQATTGVANGVPYSTANGEVTLANHTFSVPGTSECSTIIGNQVNDAVGIPSGSGSNHAILRADFSPILTKGVNASFTATPNNGPAPLNVALNGSGSFVPAGVKTCVPALPTTANCGYRWDYDNNGTIDEVTNTASVNHIFATPGTHTVGMTVFDNDLDSDKTTRTVTVGAPLPPDLAITKSHTGNFAVGSPGSYNLAVSNVGTGATTGTTTVTDTLPTGLSFVSATGTGWSCGAVSQTVTCTRPLGILGGAGVPSITVNTNVGAAAWPSVTNTATVATAGDSAAPNNSSSDPTTVDAADLAISKSHTGAFLVGGTGTYSLEVSNAGTAATTGAATIHDTLPAGLTPSDATEPGGWDCTTAGQDVDCTHAAGIAPAESATIEIPVSVGVAAVPSVINTASVSTALDPNAANDSSSDPTSVTATPDLAIDKSHAGDFRVGSPGAYTLAVTNDGARASAGTTTVTDTLPAGLTPTNASGTDWICNVLGQDVTCTSDETLDPNEDAAPISISVDVDASALPSVTNTANVDSAGTGDDEDLNPANDSDDDPTTVTATDLTIDKSHAGGFGIGQEGVYTLAVTNEGDAATVGTTTVTDTLPPELTFVSATGTGWSCGAAGQDVTCTRGGAVAAGQTAPVITLTVDVGLTEEEEITNSATVSGADDVNGANDSDSDPTALTSTDLELVKTHSSDFRAGNTRAYILRVNNIGSGPTVGTTTVTDTLPDGLDYVNATGSGWTCSLDGEEVTCDRAAAIADGDSAPPITLQVLVGADAYPGVTNVATVSNQEDGNDANDTASDPTVVHANDLALSKTSSGSFHVGGEASYEIDVSNVGDADTGAPAVVTDELPDGLTFAGANGSEWSCSALGQVVTCEHAGAIAAGDGAQTLELLADVASDAASEITNEASVEIPEDPNTADNSDDDTADVGRIDLAIDKSHTEQPERGGEGSYTIDVSNVGDLDSDGPAHVSDALPTELTYAGATGAGWSCSISSGTVSCDHAGPIAAGGAAAPITLDVVVDNDAPATIDNTASVSTRDDADGSNDSDTDSANISPSLDAAVSIRPRVPDPPDDKFRVGTNATYTVAVRNDGADDLSGPISAEVTLPAGLTFTDYEGNGWSCSAAGAVVTCTHADGLEAETRSDVGIEVVVASTAVPSVTTGVEISAPGDGNAANDTDSATTDVEMIDLAVAMSHAPASFAPGGAGAFLISVENVGNADGIDPVTVTDALPSGLSFVSASGTGWACSHAGGTVTCTSDDHLHAGEQAADIVLNVSAAAGAAGQTVENTATASTSSDGDLANNTASDSVGIGVLPPPAQQQGAQLTPPTTTPAKKCKAKKKKGKKKKKCKRKGRKR